jgi:hypothetical protein
MSSPDTSRTSTLNIPLDYQGALQTEIISTLRAAHTDLLKRFAASARNQLRVEIVLFETLLAELAEWAEGSERLSELAHKARWWESYWYEREYGDSNFADLSASEEDEMMASRRLFYRHHVGLWIATIDFNALGPDMLLAAESSDATLRPLARLSSRPDWSDLSYAIAHASPTMRELLFQSIAICIKAVDPARYTEEFLDFLREHDAFGVTWSKTAPQVAISIATPWLNEVVVSQAPLDPTELMSEMARTRVNAEVDSSIRDETEWPIEDLFTVIRARAA